MNESKHVLMALACTVILLSCGGGGKQPATADGFSDIEKEIKSEFGEDAYFTDISITHNESIGNIVGITVTQDPSSLQMGQWNQTQGTWRQNSEITIEVPQGSQAKDFMYQLDDNINLSKLGGLVEESGKKLTADKSIDNPALHMAFIKFPKNGDVSKTEYTIMLQPANGGTTFTFRYDLSGEFIKMDY